MSWSAARMLSAATRGAVKATAAVADGIRRPPKGLVVLIYHRVGRRTHTEVDLPLTVFSDQIEWLAGTLPVVSLDDGLAWVGAPAVEGDADVRVAITFDDGTADFADLAAPVLEQHRAPATLYVATEHVEEQRPFPHDGVPLSWSSLRDCTASGLVSIGSHTHSHALLDRLPAPDVPAELDRSIDLIGTRLGLVARHFAYPKAVMGSAAAERAVRDRFASAALAGGHANVPGCTDVHKLARTPVQVSDGQRWFRRKARGGLALEESIRRVLNRWRYSGATT